MNIGFYHFNDSTDKKKQMCEIIHELIKNQRCFRLTTIYVSSRTELTEGRVNDFKFIILKKKTYWINIIIYFFIPIQYDTLLTQPAYTLFIILDPFDT